MTLPLMTPVECIPERQMDRVSAERRSEIMSHIRGRDTVPEMRVRCYLHAHSLRYRLHVKGLPGKPDLVFPSRRACVFVHGCFWHGCPKCVDGARKVKSNEAYWNGKVAGNRSRDERNIAALQADGWKVFVIWECEVRADARLGALAEALRALPQCHPSRQ